MIRKLRNEDTDKVMQVWFDTNRKAHSFISENYWKDNYEAVKELLPQSEVYVYEDDYFNEIKGFIGINDNYIAGIFVCSKIQSKGIGKQLLNYVKNIRKQLTLSVYQKNKRAVKFYQSEDFKIQSEHIDENTGQKEYFMIWER